MKRHESVRSRLRHWRLAGLVAGVQRAHWRRGVRRQARAATRRSVEQAGALTAPANDWPQFQHDAVHSGNNLAETAFTSAKLRKPLHIAFKAHYGSSGDESGAVEAGGVLYVGDSGSDPDFAGKVSAFNAAGCGGAVGGSCEPLWQGITGGGITDHAGGEQRLRDRRVARDRPSTTRHSCSGSPREAAGTRPASRSGAACWPTPSSTRRRRW